MWRQVFFFLRFVYLRLYISLSNMPFLLYVLIYVGSVFCSTTHSFKQITMHTPIEVDAVLLWCMFYTLAQEWTQVKTTSNILILCIKQRRQYVYYGLLFCVLHGYLIVFDTHFYNLHNSALFCIWISEQICKENVLIL